MADGIRFDYRFLYHNYFHDCKIILFLARNDLTAIAINAINVIGIKNAINSVIVDSDEFSAARKTTYEI